MMRSLAVCGWFAAAAFSQTLVPSTPVRGVVLERDSEPAGEFSVRTPDNYVLRYRFNRATSVVRQGVSGDMHILHAGDLVEVDSDPGGDEPLAYARAIHVTVPAPLPVKREPPPPRLRAYSSRDDRFALRGDLAFSGVIVKVDGTRLVLRTRAAGEQTIVLRQDTRYLENGTLTAVASLKPAMRVFVRGGKNFYGDVEGYQVMWGQILEVR